MSARAKAAPAGFDVERMAEEISGQVRERIRPLLDRYRRQGSAMAEALSVGGLVERMVSVIPEPSDWNQVIGPFYRTSGVTTLLGGISRQALDERRRRRTLLALRTSDGEWVYPTFQFDRGEVLPGMAVLLRAFDVRNVDGWTLAGWFRTSRRSLGGRSIADWLREERPIEPVLTLARDAARRFAQ